MGKRGIQNIGRVISFAGSRVFILYLIMFGLFYISVDYRAVMDKARAAALSRLMPSFDYLAEYFEGRGTLDAQKLGEAIFYHKKVAQYVLVLSADAYGVIGFCYHQLGMQKEAASFYQKAAQDNPYLFWFHYNQGVLNFRNQEYTSAMESLKMAVSVNPELTLKIINSSKVYRDIMRYVENPERKISQHLAGGYVNAHTLLVACCYRLKDFEGVLRFATRALHLKSMRRDFFLFHAGMAAYELKKYPQAVDFLKEALDANPKNPFAIYYLGLSLRLMEADDSPDSTVVDPEMLERYEEYTNQIIGGINPQLF